MNDSLLDISGKIEPHKAAVLTAVDRAARKIGIPFFVVGGAARDFILQDGYTIRTPRVTLDVDIGVSVSSWDEFTRLIETLVSVENFKRTEIEHRLESPTLSKINVDILPFGAIEGEKRTILWRQGNHEMNMAGFNEAYKAAVNVKISSSPAIAVKIVSLAGLALLKLISWKDKPDERDRDAKDFRTIMYRYLDAHPTDYVFNVHLDIASDGDYDLISARTLGRDIKTTGGPGIHSQLVEILNRESDQTGSLQFILQMQTTSFNQETTVSRDIGMLKAVYRGVTDIW
jgi:predicted nucleotidyltransferase